MATSSLTGPQHPPARPPSPEKRISVLDSITLPVPLATAHSAINISYEYAFPENIISFHDTQPPIICALCLIGCCYQHGKIQESPEPFELETFNSLHETFAIEENSSDDDENEAPSAVAPQPLLFDEEPSESGSLSDDDEEAEDVEPANPDSEEEEDELAGPETEAEGAQDLVKY